MLTEGGAECSSKREGIKFTKQMTGHVPHLVEAEETGGPSGKSQVQAGKSQAQAVGEEGSLSVYARGASEYHDRRGAAREYVDFDPVVEWKLPGEDQDVVEISLPGFRKDQVRVQVDNHGVLRATGERSARGGRWARFKKDLLLPDNCDADGIRAKFEGEKLIITLPVVPAAPTPSPTEPETPPSPLPHGTPAAVPGQMKPPLQERAIAVSPSSPAPLPPRHAEEARKKQLQDATSPAALPPRLSTGGEEEEQETNGEGDGGDG
ncbi:uncharacterized protein LOC120666453 isoform X2 [Panicum virgatum]|uniref:uncharacterized protein LOC120666453 isoform X2 n=1 Tax=Panicum virgatum TaxID=38727 RepID=UPI0019D669E4|nr:uncharacterized protein LOC120666453 isoform X2 [Panicum virgatum]